MAGEKGQVPRTVQWKKFSGINLTDSRVAIGDDEFAWLENAVTVGNGAIQITRGPGDPIAIVGGGLSVWGFTLNGNAVLIVVRADGGMTQVAVPSGTLTVVAPAATLTGVAHLTIWRDTHILIVAGNGYWSWDGTTLVKYPLAFAANTHTSTTLDGIGSTAGLVAGAGISGAGIPNGTTIASILGATSLLLSAAATATAAITATVGGGAPTSATGIAVFEGRVWFSLGRVIRHTSPGTFADFNAANGAGSFTITDEAFPGSIVALVSALEQLWVLGQGAIEAIANVVSVGTSPTVITTFSVTNIVAGLGTTAAQSALGYFRALAFVAPFGVYALAGVTPQKLSESLDGFFTDLDLTNAPIPAALAIVESLPALCLLVPYIGPEGEGPLVIAFVQGRWFFARQGDPVWITSVLVNGVAQAWATDGSNIFRLFGAAATQPVDYRVVSKLYDLGSATTAKMALKLGFEFQAPNGAIAPIVTIESESNSRVVDIIGSNTITVILNDAGEELTPLLNDLGEELSIVTGGLILSRQNAQMEGRYLGWSIEGRDTPYRIQAVELEYQDTRQWSTP